VPLQKQTAIPQTGMLRSVNISTRQTIPGLRPRANWGVYNKCKAA